MEQLLQVMESESALKFSHCIPKMLLLNSCIAVYVEPESITKAVKMWEWDVSQIWAP